MDRKHAIDYHLVATWAAPMANNNCRRRRRRRRRRRSHRFPNRCRCHLLRHCNSMVHKARAFLNAKLKLSHLQFQQNGTLPLFVN